MKTAEQTNHDANPTSTNAPITIKLTCRQIGEPCVFGSNRCRKCGRHREPSSAALMVQI